MEEKSYTSTHPLGHTGPVTVKLYAVKTRNSFLVREYGQAHIGKYFALPYKQKKVKVQFTLQQAMKTHRAMYGSTLSLTSALDGGG